MKATITLSTDRAKPMAIEYLDSKRLKKFPPDFARIRVQWDAGDLEGAKGALLPFLVASLGDPLWRGGGLSTTFAHELEPRFTIRDVIWTEYPLPDLAIDMRLDISLCDGVSPEDAAKAVLAAACDDCADPETFGQVVSISWQTPAGLFLLASPSPWKFSLA